MSSWRFSGLAAGSAAPARRIRAEFDVEVAAFRDRLLVEQALRYVSLDTYSSCD